LSKDATGLVVGSRKLKEYYEKQGVSPAKLRVVYPTADYEMFQPSRPDGDAQRRDARIRIGFVGNMRPWHRADLLLHAFRALSTYQHLELLMIGDGPELDNLRKVASDLGLDDHVNFLGSVRYEEVPALLSKLDVCVIPHATWYGSPTKLFEYGAMAKAVIGPRDTPVAEIIEDGCTGALINCGEVGQLTGAMERLSSDPELRQRLGHALRAKLVAEISWPINVRTILALAGENGKRISN
jgi:glycosyltransferase involved in cell wall biosynthesis